MKLVGKKPVNPQVAQSFIKVPNKMTAQQRAAYARIKAILKDYQEELDAPDSIP